jgi:predicted aspartyl protease
MANHLRRNASWGLLSSLVAALCVACSQPAAIREANSETPVTSPDTEAVTPTVSDPSIDSANAPAPEVPDPYDRAIDRASSAFTISQSAQSLDDWRLVANRWQQAIALMQDVPPTSPHHAEAQAKIAEYQSNLAYAQEQANRPLTAPPSTTVTVTPSTGQRNPAPAAPTRPSASASTSSGTGRVFRAPIVRRAGGTPVISVLFNGNRRYDMIVDTGASGTLITRQMAMALGVVPVGETRVDTASARSVSFPLGFVRSIQVDGAIARNVLVAVAGPELNIGLLGHDFFGDYDVTIRENEVEFRER